MFFLKKQDPEILFEKFLMYFQKNKFKKVIRLGEKLQNLYPNFFIIYFNLGYAYYTTKQYNEALTNFIKASDLVINQQDLISCYEWIGECYSQLDNIELALQYYKKCTELGVFLPNIIAKIGIIYFNDEKYDLAEKFFESSLYDNEDFILKSYILFLMSFIFEKKNDINAVLKYNLLSLEEIINTADISLYITVVTNLKLLYNNFRENKNVNSELLVDIKPFIEQENQNLLKMAILKAKKIKEVR